MTPAARVQAAIELLDQVIDAAKSNGPPADRIVAAGLRERRYAGSKDRRAIRELAFAAIRACGPVPENGRAAMLALAETDKAIAPLFDGSQYGPRKIAEGETAAESGVASAWLVERLSASDIADDEAAALLERAPLDVRVNALKAERAGIALPEQGEVLSAPDAIRFPHGTPVEQWPAYRDGLIEVQDHGSQLACLAAGVQPGETVIDLCAGAGGKTLALAAAMQNQGTLIACDTDKRRLSQLAPRAERAGAKIDRQILLDPNRELEALQDWRGNADCVFVDAPCSGSGTWRRKPDARWRLTPDQFERYIKAQAHILQYAAELVRPGGRLIFVTCSLFDEEGADQIEAFLTATTDFGPASMALPLGRERGHGVRLTPHHDGTDGFFIARSEKL